jgi:hypothetical protein
MRQGDWSLDVRELYAYLQDFGYLPGEPMLPLSRGFTEPPKPPPFEKMRYDETIAEAVTLFQRTHNLCVDGMVNEETLRLIRTPRCAFPDIIRPEYVTTTPWDHTNLTYRFDESLKKLNLDIATSQNAFRTAFAKWQAISKLTFTESTSHFDFSVFSYDFGSKDGKYAGTYPPPWGDMYYDIQETWSVDDPPSGNVDLIGLALHEIGHAIGLDHSFKGTVMYGYFNENGVEIRRNLAADDVNGVNALYP